MVAFPLPLASLLTGASPSQLRAWRQKSILVPEVSEKRPPLYSFRDLVALRSIAFLRARTSSQRVSKAFRSLDLLDLTEHPSKYRFATNGDTIVVDHGEGYQIDLVRAPGQLQFHTFAEIMAPFENFRGDQVAHFEQPSQHVSVRLRRLGGWPTVIDTRIPYEAIVSLVDFKTVGPEDVPRYYPNVSAEAAADVLEFHRKIGHAA